MKTEILKAPNERAEKEIRRAGEILKMGGLVAIPTETVYGLAANAFSKKAVEKIFVAKGRPGDNPLIVHISDMGALSELVLEVPEKAKKCMKAFWPGPFTAVVKKSNKVPSVVSGGLDTVAIRMPENKVARGIIESAGLPLAAPSANLSGSPSPTTAEHCIRDLSGRVEAIVVSTDCKIGVESTVVTFAENPPRLLRPGGITVEQIRELVPDLVVDRAVLYELEAGQKAASPGMKYKHYSPKAEVIMALGSTQSFVEYCNKNKENFDIALCFEEDKNDINIKTLCYGKSEDYFSQAEMLFARLREIDNMGIKRVIAHGPEKKGVGLAVYNRLIRAAAFRVVEL